MVAGPGIEPRSEAYETSELPLLYPAINLAALGGNDPHSSTVTVSCASMNTLRPNNFWCPMTESNCRNLITKQV
jgi:hypothetical protein